LSDWFGGGQILVGVELHGNATALTGLRMTCVRSRRAQHSTTAAHRHAFRQGDFRWHGESQFDDRALRERCLGVKKYSTAAQVLNETGHRPPFEVNGQRLMCFETLSAPAFETIGTFAHRCILLAASRSSGQLDQRSLTLSWIDAAGKLQGSHPAELWKYDDKVNTIALASRASSFFQGPSSLGVIPCRQSQDVKKF
jgi:hypothetical protein